MGKTSTYRVIGKRVPRVDAKKKATGAAKYTVDLDLPGMLHGKVLRSPHPHAEIKNIDTSEAEKLLGVRGILTYKNVPDVSYNPSTRYNFPMGELPEDEKILPKKARFVGDRVAAVAADSKEIAEKALELIKVEYNELTPVFDPEEAMKEGAPRIHDGAENNIVKHIARRAGDVEKAFEDADFVFEDEFETQPQQHAQLEPHVCIADFSLEGDLKIWSSTQVPFQVRLVVSKVLDLPEQKVKVKKPFVGGGFGGKDEVFDEILAALLSKKTGRPVKIELDRSEDITTTRTRHASKIKLKVGVKKDGTITALKMKSILNAGAYSAASPRVTMACGARPIAIYRLKNYNYDGYGVYTNLIPGGAFRGYGNPQYSFAMESLMDIIAEKLGIDPVEIRLKNGMKEGDPNLITGGTIDSCGLSECLERGKEKIGYHKKKSYKTNGTKRRGMGVAIAAHWTTVWPYCSDYAGATVVINDDGTVNLLVGAAEIGQGSDTILSQIAAEVLGVELEDISIQSGDTQATSWDPGAYSSRTTHVSGNAVANAALDAKNQLLAEAADIMDTSVEKLKCENRKIFVRGDRSKTISLPNLMEKINRRGKIPIIGRGTYQMKTNAPTYVAHFAEVEVDVEMGTVAILRYVACQDVGTAVNPVLVEGQVEGSVQQGIGYVLREGIIHDRSTGVVMNPSIHDYAMPTSMDMPEIDTIIIPTDEPSGSFGLKGAAEVSMSPVAPAIANAIYDAVGVRIKSLPITPEKILEKLEKGDKRKL